METNKIRFQADSNCTSIIYTLDSDETINVFSNGMLTNNNIKGLLSYTYEDYSGNKILSYSVSKGIILATIKKQTLKKDVILTILKNITDILLTVEEYMLDIDNILLDDEFIFIDPSTLEPSLIFVPTNKPYRKPVRAFIKNCILSGVFDLSEDATYIMQINNFLNSNEKSTVKEISGFLDGLLGEKNGAPAMPNNTPNSSAVLNAAPAQNYVQPAPKPEYNAAPSVKKAPQPKNNIPVSDGEASGKKKGLFGGLFDKEKKEKNAPASASGSFSGMDIPGMAPASSAPAAPKASPAKANVKHANTPMPAAQNNQPVPTPSAAQPAPVYAGTASGSFENEKTVFLGQGNSGNSLKAFLVNKNGTMSEINTDCFFIGKGVNSGIPNNLVVQNNSVSRNHAVIERVGSEYYIKDNNSLNGTFVNGQQISPNIRAALNNGDKVMLANEEFTFTLR